jgi:hypothetical protein
MAEAKKSETGCVGWIVLIVLGLIVFGWISNAVGCSSDASGPSSVGSKIVACQDEVRSRAAPVAIDFGGIMDSPDVTGDAVTGTASAVVGGTKVSFTYQCTVDDSGTVIDVSTDLPS